MQFLAEQTQRIHNRGTIPLTPMEILRKSVAFRANVTLNYLDEFLLDTSLTTVQLDAHAVLYEMCFVGDFYEPRGVVFSETFWRRGRRSVTSVI